jgi:hypothetical protein
MPSSSALRTCLLTSALFLGLAAVGCTAEGADEEEGTGSSADELRNGRGRGHHGGGHGNGWGHGPHGADHLGHRGRQHVEQPQGVFFANINANGTGCPEGTWSVGISEDGETFTLVFSAYEAIVGPGQARDVKDCTLDINLGSHEGLSYSVASFNYQGYILLDKEGMKARQTANYYFENNRENGADKNEVTGPFDQSYLFTDEIGPGRRAWSPCRRDDTLHVKTRLVMRNDDAATGSGYINNATVDGSVSFKWKLNWRRCPGQ